MAWKRGSMSFSENARPFARKGGSVWYIIKAGELILAATCLLLLLVAHIIYPVRDNFSTSYTCHTDDNYYDGEGGHGGRGGRNYTNRTITKSQVSSTSQVPVQPLGYFNAVSAVTNKYPVNEDCWYYDDYSEIRVSKNPRNAVPLGLLLALYVTCVTIIIAVLVEIISLLLKDPVNKCPSILLTILYIGLSSIMFFVSLFAAIKTGLIVLIIFCLLAGILLILTVTDFVLLLYS